MNITDGEVVIAMAAGRQMLAVQSDAQHIVDRKNHQIVGLQRELAAARREIAALKAERGGRNMALFAAAVRKH